MALRFEKRKPRGMIQVRRAKPGTQPQGVTGDHTVYEGALVFAGAAVVIFLLNSRFVNIFDEGILLTGTMRTMAGQVLHRDFNYNYGPALFYLYAALFKLFGTSILVERIAAALSDAGLVVSVYLLARKLCGRVPALAASIACILWSIGIGLSWNLLNSSFCIFMLWTAWLILPQTDKRLERRRAAFAGFLTAIIFLFRYDLGIGTAAASLVAMVIMRWLQERGESRSPRRLMRSQIGPYLAVFAITVTPAAIAYLSVAPIHDLLYDVVIYMAKYYRAGRGLPFPGFQEGAEVAVYLLPIIILLSAWIVVRWFIARRTNAHESAGRVPDWVNLLVSLIVVATLTCVKGLVRVGVGGMYGTLIACAVLGAALIQHRSALNLWLRALMMATLALFVLGAAAFDEPQLVRPNGHLQPLVINWLLTPARQPPTPAFRSWCHEDTPITRGLCFLMEEDHIRAVRYLDAHTLPSDYIYVGLDHHDRIFANDMILYFAAQRLPAVKWTEFDPYLQNRADIQREMISTLEQHKPPYIVLSSEFDTMREPNGSSVSTGVHLLDDYIATHYEEVQQYNRLTILRRRK